MFHLVMINVIAVDSIRSLPFSASYGWSLLFFYILAAIFFFIPSALVSAELATGWPTTGGIYIWVREAFGKKMSFIVIWLSWIYNVVWYPTIMALIAGTFTYFFDPNLANNKIYMTCAVLLLFWGATLVNCFGMKLSSLISTIGTLVGTIFPMILITVLGVVWIGLSKPLHITFSWESFFPDLTKVNQLSFLTAVLFGLLGLEMSATHAAEVKNPKQDYPRAQFFSAIIILVTLICSSLAIAIVIPAKQLSLATGVIQAFSIFVDAFDLPWLLPLIVIFIILGGLGVVAAWIIGPTKGLMVAGEDGTLPKFFEKKNKRGVPINILLLQATIVSVLSFAFILMPTVNSSFWLLSAITAQLALIVYMMLFASALKLHYEKGHIQRTFRVPGGKMGMWVTCGCGILACTVVILLGFIPPEQVLINNVFSYEFTLIGGMLIALFLPFLFLRRKKIPP